MNCLSQMSHLRSTMIPPSMMPVSKQAKRVSRVTGRLWTGTEDGQMRKNSLFGCANGLD
jgi:hypothetical protein